MLHKISPLSIEDGISTWIDLRLSIVFTMYRVALYSFHPNSNFLWGYANDILQKSPALLAKLLINNNVLKRVMVLFQECLRYVVSDAI